MLTNTPRRAASDSSVTSSCTLLSRVKAEEVSAWERLVALYEPLVLLWCHEARVPDELVKETLELVFRAIAVGVVDFHPDRLNCSFRGWVRTITRNILAEMLEPARLTTACTAEVEFATGSANSASLETVNEESLLFGSALQLIHTEFAPQIFDLFTQTVLEQQSPAAVAQQMQISLETVRLAKSRVLFRLREEFGTLLD